MKMVMAVVAREEAETVLRELISRGHTATYTESRGGILRQSQLTLFVAVQEAQLEEVLCVVRDHCRRNVNVECEDSAPPDGTRAPRVSASVGGSVIFVWDLTSFETG
jgi:uncharacterized protein YaaQ